MRTSRVLFVLSVFVFIHGLAGSGLTQGNGKDFGGQAEYTRPKPKLKRAAAPQIQICWRDLDLDGTATHVVQHFRTEAAFVAEITDRLNETESCSGVMIWMETLDADIFPILATIEKLESLTIVGSTLRAGSLRQLQKCSALKYVSLDGCLISDANCAELSKLQSLESLQLTGATVTDRGLKDLSGIKTLRELDLRGSRITDVGLKALHRNHKLRVLDVRGTSVTAIGVQSLARSLKNIRIHFRPIKRTLQIVKR